MKTTTSRARFAAREIFCVASAIAMMLAGACKLSSVDLGSDVGGAGTGATGGGASLPTGGTDECPASAAVAEGASCTRPRELTCVYPTPNGWNACVCGCEHPGLYSCFGAGGIEGLVCPTTPPTPGSACDGFEGGICPYFPYLSCGCDAQTHVWSCSQYDQTWPCLAPPPDVGAPAVEPTKHVADLTAAEAETWCEWFITTVFTLGGPAPPPDRAVEPDGTVWGYATDTCSGIPGLCTQRLSLDHCVANLMLGTCQAPVYELDDCAATVADNCVAVGQGCDAYLAQPGCDRTIVTNTAIGGDTCSLPVQ